MPVTLDRRGFVQGLVAGLMCRPAAAFAPAPMPELPVLAQFATGNNRLNPLTHAAGSVLYCGDTTIGAVSLAQAAPLWSHGHGFDSPAEYRPRFAEGLMVCGGRKWLAAYDAASGAEVWRYTAQIQTGVPWVTPQVTVFGDGHQITALDTLTGKPLWQHAAIVDTLASYAPTGTTDTVFVGPGDGHLYALNLSDGAVNWVVDGRTTWQYLRQIQVEGDLLVAGTYKERLVGLSLADGAQRWSFNAGNFINSQHVADGSAYLWSPTGWIYAIDTGSGQVRWRYQTTDFDGAESNWASVLAELQTLGDRLFVLDMKDVLHVLNRAGGDGHSQYRLPQKVRHAILPIAGVGIACPTLGGEILLAALP
ncbi:MAG: PQQ-binding-like beta-propeller repeat protein [Rhodobacteraceae bacterium]|nr:PQQ-binding-like beta-propeller repeat protein [Paracoccaceae bacterium]